MTPFSPLVGVADCFFVPQEPVERLPASSGSAPADDERPLDV